MLNLKKLLKLLRYNKATKKQKNKFLIEKTLLNPSTTETDKFLDEFRIPEPTRSLLWVTDSEVSRRKSPSEYVITVFPSGLDNRLPGHTDELDRFNFYAEPSLIWTKLPVKRNNDFYKETFYGPSYYGLSPKMKFEYLNWLKNIERETNMSYVFLYYYGLERHLVYGFYEKAILEILRLLNRFKNNFSFLSYASIALLTTIAYHRRFDIIENFPEILEYPTNELLYLRFLCKKDIDAKYIMKLFYEKKVQRNKYVIDLANKHPQLFEEELDRVVNHYKDKHRGILTRIKKENLNKLRRTSFANLSLPKSVRTFNTYEILSDGTFQSVIRSMISRTYRSCCNELKR